MLSRVPKPMLEPDKILAITIIIEISTILLPTLIGKVLEKPLARTSHGETPNHELSKIVTPKAQIKNPTFNIKYRLK